MKTKSKLATCLGILVETDGNLSKEKAQIALICVMCVQVFIDPQFFSFCCIFKLARFYIFCWKMYDLVKRVYEEMN